MEINSNSYPAIPAQAMLPKAPRKAETEQPASDQAAAMSSNPAAAEPAAAAAAEAPTSGAKAFTYGVLGIERPEDTTPVTDHSYSVGNWTGAGLKIGGLIALLV